MSPKRGKGVYQHKAKVVCSTVHMTMARVPTDQGNQGKYIWSGKWGKQGFQPQKGIFFFKRKSANFCSVSDVMINILKTRYLMFVLFHIVHDPRPKFEAAKDLNHLKKKTTLLILIIQCTLVFVSIVLQNQFLNAKKKIIYKGTFVLKSKKYQGIFIGLVGTVNGQSDCFDDELYFSWSTTKLRGRTWKHLVSTHTASISQL